VTHFQLFEYLPDVSEATLWGEDSSAQTSNLFLGHCIADLCNIPVLLEALSFEDWLRSIGKVFGEWK